MRRVHKAQWGDADTILVDGEPCGLLEVEGLPISCLMQDGHSVLYYETEHPTHQVLITYTGRALPPRFEHFCTWSAHRGSEVFHAFRRCKVAGDDEAFGPLKQG